MKDAQAFSITSAPLSGTAAATESPVRIRADEFVAIFVTSPSEKCKFNCSLLTSIRQVYENENFDVQKSLHNFFHNSIANLIISIT